MIIWIRQQPMKDSLYQINGGFGLSVARKFELQKSA